MNSTLFSSLPIEQKILDAISLLGYEHMTPIQAASLPDILHNKDLIGQAKTGSGKTASFAIGLLSKIDVTNRDIQAIVLCPTRELSEQVSKEIRALARQIPNVKIATLCGGSPMRAQITTLSHMPHCVVGTPGRVLDHLCRNTLDLSNVKTVVLDEADRMLEMGFQDDITQIVNATPKNRQTLLFSATYPENIQRLSQDFQQDAVFIKADVDQSTISVEQLFFEKRGEDFAIVDAILTKYRPESTLIFCNTKQKCNELKAYLQKQHYAALALHGDLDQRERDEALVLFSNKSLSILVATDVAARGLDIKDLSAVINFELARDLEVHIHRIGRTARAGKAGLVFSLISPFDKHRIHAIEEFQQKNIEIATIETLDLKEKHHLTPSMATIRISCGRKNKLRAGDILGALTAQGGIEGPHVGKIDICDTHSFVAVDKNHISHALEILTKNTIKGRFLRVELLNLI